MAINRNTTMVFSTYMSKALVAKLDEKAMQLGINRNRLINLIVSEYFWDEILHDMEGVKEYGEK